MTQRRTPSGQGPARRSGPAARPGGRTPGRSTVRDTATRLEPRSATGRAGLARTTAAVRLADGNRSASRPASARRTAAVGATKRTVATRPRAFTGRATILLVVLAALALGYTYPVRIYLAQESKIGRMQAAQAAQEAEIRGKAEEVQKWQDPEYIRIKARERFYYVRRGETPLLVYKEQTGAGGDTAGRPAASAKPGRWYDTLWSSVAGANADTRP